MISYVMVTKDRHERLGSTLLAIASLEEHEAEVVVVDNASSGLVKLPARIGPIPIRTVHSSVNMGAAGRNLGVAAADQRSEWVVMLDDDSHPIDTAFVAGLERVAGDVAAVSADISVPRAGAREQGGLPEVFIGCGVAIRRRVFEKLGGYDAAMGYYAEEYDLAARMLLAGHRVAFDPAFRVLHHKDTAQRDMDTIVARLVRNNGWVAQRYAPDGVRRERLREVRTRYRTIARRERATAGYGRGLLELRRTIGLQRRIPMPTEIDDRFTGLAHARAALGRQHSERALGSGVAVVDGGKNEWVVRQVLAELGVRVVAESGTAPVVVIGTMSPGPMLDAAERWRGLGKRVVAPWEAAAGGGAARAAA